MPSSVFPHTRDTVLPTTTKNGQIRHNVVIHTNEFEIIVNTPAGKQLCKQSLDYFTKLAQKQSNYTTAQKRMLKKLADKNAK